MSEALQRLRQRLSPDPGVADTALPQAAVLILFDTTGDELQVVLAQRAAHLRLHAGEVAFPGGKCEPEDTDHWDTALREANEEVALPPEAVTRIGVLPAVVTRTGIEVTACVAHLEQAVDFVPNPEELDVVFKAPLAFFARDDELHLDEFEYAGQVRRVPRYEWNGYTIWGITAALLVKLVNEALDAGLHLEDYWKGSTP